MASLWGGRFEKEMDELVKQFNASIGFDKEDVQRGYRRKHRPRNHAGGPGNRDRRGKGTDRPGP